MSESERRRKYRSNRVLIESERILDPQFSDAVIYLTGAQIEMLRNVTQYLNRLETYVAEYASGYYLAPNAEDYDSILAIVADLEETLMGNPNTIWGYADQWYKQVVETAVGQETLTCETIPVPAGYVYVLENVVAFHNAGVTRNVELLADVQDGHVSLYAVPSMPSDDVLRMPVNVTLKEGDTVQWTVVAVPDTKNALLRVLGYKMVVPE